MSKNKRKPKNKWKSCRHPKSTPYGKQGTDPYCHPHDQCMTYKVNNKAARSKAKRQIKKELKDI